MSYPYLSDLVKDWTGVDVPLPIAMFGLFVGMATLVAAALMSSELRRKHLAKQLGNAYRDMTGADGRPVRLEQPPQAIVSDFTFAVLIAGVVGARLFHILEHLDSFWTDPGAMVFSRSGFSIFGGLIFGAIVGLVFVRRWHLPGRLMLDATAPAMMLGYAVGRIGCQVAGDGDWGIAANMQLKPDWLPSWAWAQTYDHNIMDVAIALPGVYPTPLYETLAGVACFALLWAWRKHPYQAGWLFSVYLVLAGIERLAIEQIRVNPIIDLGFARATQAEFIAVVLMVAGAAGALLLRHPVRSGIAPSR